MLTAPPSRECVGKIFIIIPTAIWISSRKPYKKLLPIPSSYPVYSRSNR
ncbi:hypothetical protein [Rubritalea tangerina]